MKRFHPILAAIICLVFSAALGQDVTKPPSDLPSSMQIHGPAVAFVSHTLSIETNRIDGEIPTSQISKIAQISIRDRAAETRSAKDSAIYRAASPSVVLIVTKDGLGSGALVSTAGEVITNWHVVQGFSSVAVVFKPILEGEEPGRDDIKLGRVVKYDQVADLALIKVDDPPLGRSPIRLGDSGEISIGADVHAIGHPTGEAWTYTKGVISQYRRQFVWTSKGESLKHKADVIQTQTPINPGNSGGPLISDSSTLIGVNAFKAEGENLNFAISIDDIRRFLGRAGNVPGESSSASSSKPSCQGKELSQFRRYDNKATVITYDSYCKGTTSAWYTVPDASSEPITLAMDRNGDGITDAIFYDFKHSGKWELSYWDDTFTGRWSLVGFHRDGTLRPTSFESYDAFQKRLASQR